MAYIINQSCGSENFFDMVCVSGGFWQSRSHLYWCSLLIYDKSEMLDSTRNKTYSISLINTASSISTQVRYYSITNNIEMVVIFISNTCTPSTSTACHFTTPDYRVMMAVSSIIFRVITSSCKKRGKIYNY